MCECVSECVCVHVCRTSYIVYEVPPLVCREGEKMYLLSRTSKETDTM